MDSRTKPQSGEKIRADILTRGIDGREAPVGYRSSSSISRKVVSGSLEGCCWRYTTNSQCGTGNIDSDGLLGDDVHGFNTASKDVSCSSITLLRPELSNLCASPKASVESVKCGKAKIPANFSLVVERTILPC